MPNFRPVINILPVGFGGGVLIVVVVVLVLVLVVLDVVVNVGHVDLPLFKVRIFQASIVGLLLLLLLLSFLLGFFSFLLPTKTTTPLTVSTKQWKR